MGQFWLKENSAAAQGRRLVALRDSHHPSPRPHLDPGLAALGQNKNYTSLVSGGNQHHGDQDSRFQKHRHGLTSLVRDKIVDGKSFGGWIPRVLLTLSRWSSLRSLWRLKNVSSLVDFVMVWRLKSNEYNPGWELVSLLSVAASYKCLIPHSQDPGYFPLPPLAWSDPVNNQCLLFLL